LRHDVHHRWRAGGRDRAVARAAFAADLPPAIIGRRSKGGPDGFSAIVLREHRTAIRERLLARERGISVAEVERHLASAVNALDLGLRRLGL